MAKKRALTIVFSCCGRRVELLQAFRAAAEKLDVRLTLVGTDATPTAPAMAAVDHAELSPRIDDPAYIPHLHDVVSRYSAQAIVPTIDTELPVLAAEREGLASGGCSVMVASEDVIRICFDKQATANFLRAHEIETPRTWTPQQLESQGNLEFPLFIKPRRGSASIGAHKLNDRRDYDYFVARVDDPVVQELLVGEEFTLDVYVGLSGIAQCVVPRKRLAVRTGEVVKGVVLKERDIMAAGERVVQALGDSVRGLVTLQCIRTEGGRIAFIEINPRFGGGAPMGIAAGADYPAWLMQELLGERPEVDPDAIQHGLMMLRHDWSVFLPLGRDAVPKLVKPLKPPPKW